MCFEIGIAVIREMFLFGLQTFIISRELLLTLSISLDPHVSCYAIIWTYYYKDYREN